MAISRSGATYHRHHLKKSQTLSNIAVIIIIICSLFYCHFSYIGRKYVWDNAEWDGVFIT